MSKFEGVHPVLVQKVSQVMAAMKALGFEMVVTDGLRTTERQQVLYAQGRTTPGPIVTQADGIEKRSHHQEHADGFGHAIDATFLDAKGQPTWSDAMPWDAYGVCAEALGLKWGGRWATPDRPHVELW